MTLRITNIPGKDNTIIRVEGHLTARGGVDLNKMIQGVAEPVHLDLSGLRSADAEGVGALRSLSAKGAKLVGASIYTRQLLDKASL